MTAESGMVVVTEEFCNTCGTPRVIVHHQTFPEMSICGESAKQAAENLAIHLKSNLDAVSDPLHREPVRRAIADVQAYLGSDVVPQPPLQLNDVIDVSTAGAGEPEGSPSMVVKTETLEIYRLTIPKGREIPTHRVQVEIIVHCLVGRIAFASGGTRREVGAGQLIVLAAAEPHSLVGLQDSLVLVTRVRPARTPECDMAKNLSGRDTVIGAAGANGN